MFCHKRRVGCRGSSAPIMTIDTRQHTIWAMIEEACKIRQALALP
jgi:hypothetical protein